MTVVVIYSTATEKERLSIILRLLELQVFMVNFFLLWRPLDVRDLSILADRPRYLALYMIEAASTTAYVRDAIELSDIFLDVLCFGTCLHLSKVISIS